MYKHSRPRHAIPSDLYKISFRNADENEIEVCWPACGRPDLLGLKAPLNPRFDLLNVDHHQYFTHKAGRTDMCDMAKKLPLTLIVLL